MKRPLLLTMLAVAIGASTNAQAAAAKTTYPVVFAHGMGGFDNLLGYDYWGDDYGTFVGDPCDQFLEVYCNGNIDSGQKAYVAQVQAFQSSEVRGLDLANDIEGFMTTAGASRVNLVGHSQGGIDIRKAARVLYERKGRTVADVVISISSPHRGSPVAKYILDLGPGVTSVIAALATYYGNSIYQSGNDAYAGAKQLVYNDYSSSDGAVTGMKAFNLAYPVDSRYASRYGSLMTAQNGLSVNPALYLLQQAFYDIDGDGYCVDDCDNDGAAGMGDGVRNERDDDGLVGINSQQMGYRLRYTEYAFSLDSVSTDYDLGYVGSLNAPTSAQMTS
ncbi:MAG TPA: acetyltransferase, partial [Dehalococcoidia bacterium]|nr:acetyltransferase [Dehalococcoidia bacterium]